MNLREQSNAFWRLFVTAALYDTGYGDTVGNCGADRCETDDDAIIACAYIKGASDMARLKASCDSGYMSRHWQIHHTVGIAAGLLLSYHRDPLGYDADKVRRNCDTWERELRALLVK